VFTGAAAGVAIYTGDSSSNGASIDNLYFAPLTSSSVGDSGGTVQQSSTGKFIDLSKDTAGALTTAATQGDTIAGSLIFTITNPDGTTSTLTTTATTVSGLISEINKDGIPGVTASFTTAAAVGDAAVAGGDTGILLSNTNPNVAISMSVAAAGPPAVLAFADTTSTIAPAALFSSTRSVTTMSYVTAGANEKSANLSVTDLQTQANSQNAVNVLNAAITYISAQDGYIGAQINTLNSISQVMSTQQENIVSAQNAIQATDYAAATSNMSKYEVLTQTGIAALAQANSVEQEVTKLLQ